MPIVIEADDQQHDKNSSKCLPYSRTIPALHKNCALGFRKQANQATSYLDASNIYGSTIQRARALRTFHNGSTFVAF